MTPQAEPKLELKPLSKEAVPSALGKAERYRLLNEPAAAESICLDILRVEPGHQQALITLLLALTDQFGKGYSVNLSQPRELLSRLEGEYAKAYYAGIICERWAKSMLHEGGPGTKHAAYGWFHEAMGWYEKAVRAHPSGNEDAVLRWNSCLRSIQRHRLTADNDGHSQPILE
ncbi:MAG TPA: hypothetical protein VL588_02230 [Bdellovibrionota bacterium]|nr:hypothetical protein [Bdellovibrionota bacterium]